MNTKILKLLIVILISITNFHTNAESGNIVPVSGTGIINIENLNQVENNQETVEEEINLEDELKKDGIDLNSATQEEKSIVEKANDMKNLEIDRLFGKTIEEKNINTLENVLAGLEIKKELASNQLSEIENNLKMLQKNIEDNNKTIASLKNNESITKIKSEVGKLEEINQNLKNDLDIKQSLISELESDLKKYSASEEKYELLMTDYLDAKKEKVKKLGNEKVKKLYYLLAFLSLFLIVYIVKILLLKNEKFKKRHPNFGEYFDLLFGISLVIFLVLYLFYLFPDLYALLILISSALILINSQVISSFVASLILFRHFKIGDIIKIGTERGKIIKMNPLSTVIKKINDYGVIENEEINIPNIDLLKEKVTLAKSSQIKENVFNIILSLKGNKDIFEIIDNIRENILLKMLDNKLVTLNPENTDTFKTKYEHIDQDKIKVTFYWIGNSELNRKIEKRIIQYIKEYIYFEETDTNKKNCKNQNKNTNEGTIQKAAIVEEQINY